MSAVSFRQLEGRSIRATVRVDCANVQDPAKTTNIFKFTCPEDMNIASINKCFGNGEHPCGWEIIYTFKPETHKHCDAENAKNAFQEIFRFLPSNVSVKEYDKQIMGIPSSYRARYSVDSCKCTKLDFDLYNFNVKLNVEN